MPELLHTLESVHKKEDDERKFLASIQGINLKEEESESRQTFEDIQMRALGLDTGITNDVVGLVGETAASKGFGINQGLGYSLEQ